MIYHSPNPTAVRAAVQQTPCLMQHTQQGVVKAFNNTDPSKIIGAGVLSVLELNPAPILALAAATAAKGAAKGLLQGAVACKPPGEAPKVSPLVLPPQLPLPGSPSFTAVVIDTGVSKVTLFP